MNKKTNYMQTRGVFQHFRNNVAFVSKIKENKEVSKGILAKLLGKIIKLLPRRNTLRGK